MAPQTSSEVVRTSCLDGGERASVGPILPRGDDHARSITSRCRSGSSHVEELKNAFKTLPRVTLLIPIANSLLASVMLMYSALPNPHVAATDMDGTFVHTIVDVEQVVSTSIGNPVIQVFYNATNSLAGATLMTSNLFIHYTANTLTNLACASHQPFAFARDGGVPFYPWFATVKLDIPIDAALINSFFSCCIRLISLSSTITFNHIVAPALGTLFLAYFVSISCPTLKQIRYPPLLPSCFSHGKLGLPINLLAMAFAMIAWVFSLLPPVNDPDLATMNWSSVVYVGMLAISFAYYVLFARHRHVGPVEYVRRSEHVRL